MHGGNSLDETGELQRGGEMAKICIFLNRHFSRICGICIMHNTYNNTFHFSLRCSTGTAHLLSWYDLGKSRIHVYVICRTESVSLVLVLFCANIESVICVCR